MDHGIAPSVGSLSRKFKQLKARKLLLFSLCAFLAGSAFARPAVLVQVITTTLQAEGSSDGEGVYQQILVKQLRVLSARSSLGVSVEKPRVCVPEVVIQAERPSGGE